MFEQVMRENDETNAEICDYKFPIREVLRNIYAHIVIGMLDGEWIYTDFEMHVCILFVLFCSDRLIYTVGVTNNYVYHIIECDLKKKIEFNHLFK